MSKDVYAVLNLLNALGIAPFQKFTLLWNTNCVHDYVIRHSERLTPGY